MSIKAATAICLGGFLLVQLFPGAIIRLFNTDNEQLLHIGRYGLRIFLAAMVKMLELVGRLDAYIGFAGKENISKPGAFNLQFVRKYLHASQ